MASKSQKKSVVFILSEMIKLSMEGVAVVDVNIKPNNQATLHKLRFKLDTGADMTTIEKRSLRLLGYSDNWINANTTKDTRMTVSSAGGSNESAYYIQIPVINFMGRDFINWPLYIRPEDDRDYRNLLGIDIFSSFDFTYRYSTGFLEIEAISNSIVKQIMLQGQRIEEIKSRFP